MKREIPILLFISLGGGVFFYLLQLSAYHSGVIALSDLTTNEAMEVWIDSYMSGSAIVIGMSVLSAFAWYFYANTARGLNKKEDLQEFASRWWRFLLSNFFSFLIALALNHFWGKSIDAYKSLFFLYLVDIFWCFWIATALSSPNQLKKMVPLSACLRELLRY